MTRKIRSPNVDSIIIKIAAVASFEEKGSGYKGKRVILV
jgi:hypothetical protein